MLRLQQVTLQRGSKLLFDQADLTIHAGQKVGIVGPNGAGKSSLFQLLQNEIETDRGTVSVPQDLKAAHIRQDMPQTEQSAVAYALEGDVEYTQLNKQLAQAEAEENGLAIADIHQKLSEIGGYEAQARVAKILRGLRFSPEDITKPVNIFSGGWRMRLNLAQVLLARADILLLDEPTNHLDLEAIMWLENWLSTCTATVLIISHDRAFLDQVCHYIVHLRNQKLYKYTGNYSTFEREYAQQLIVRQATFEKQQKQRAHIQSFVDRFRYKASKAKQAQSRLKMLERMERVEPVRALNPFRFEFKIPTAAGSPMLQLNHASVAYNGKSILHDIYFALRDGDRIGLLGPNGAGKSTFIKLLAGDISLKTGEIIKSPKLKISYFAQHQLEQLDLSETLFSTMQKLGAQLTEADIRQYLGSFHFQGNRVFEPIANFSGGEKARFVLALTIWQQPNLLLLDEPTNHLDMEMRQALTDALQFYQGAVVFVSHDRHLIESTADELWLVNDGQVKKFEGDLEDYRQWLSERDNKQAILKKPIISTKQQRKLQKQLQTLESKLEKTIAKLKVYEAELAKPALYQTDTKEALAKRQLEQEQLRTIVTELEAKILILLEQLET